MIKTVPHFKVKTTNLRNHQKYHCILDLLLKPIFIPNTNIKSFHIMFLLSQKCIYIDRMYDFIDPTEIFTPNLTFMK